MMLHCCKRLPGGTNNKMNLESLAGTDCPYCLLFHRTGRGGVVLAAHCTKVIVAALASRGCGDSKSERLSVCEQVPVAVYMVLISLQLGTLISGLKA